MSESLKKSKRGMVIFFGDLPLIASLYLAHFIVWRTLRRRRRERAARLKLIHLVPQVAPKTMTKLSGET